MLAWICKFYLFILFSALHLKLQYFVFFFFLFEVNNQQMLFSFCDLNMEEIFIFLRTKTFIRNAYFELFFFFLTMFHLKCYKITKWNYQKDSFNTLLIGCTGNITYQWGKGNWWADFKFYIWYCIHLCTNTFEKGMYLSLPPTIYGLNRKMG